ncbi:MAG: aldo/keto reductase [Clostridia bacterium]|nr:aldo/keto reductase [Clostridia bacterium]
MIYNELGKTGLIVSKLCFGGLTVGPLQADLSPVEGGKVIREAFERGVNFIDTAELYGTYPHIKEALNGFDRHRIVISSKSYAYSVETAETALEDALQSLKTDYIDLFMMHEQESEHTIRGHYEALEYYQKMKDKGYIKAIGLSTHHIAAVHGATKYAEIEVVHPILNKLGIGIQDGNIEEMLDALRRFRYDGRGVFAMKPLGGGHLIKSYDEAFDYVNNLDVVDAFAIGMQSVDEVIANVSKFETGSIPIDLKKKLKAKERKLIIADWCEGCGNCIERCGAGALSLGENGKAVVDNSKCILCGYCSKACPYFCIKVI